MLLAKADPRFELPHRTHFATKIIPQMYVSVRNRIEEQLEEVNHCTITTDLWTTSHQHRSYISLKIHFVDADFTLNSLCLKTLEVSQHHTAESLQHVLLSMYQEWNIVDKVFGGTTDNGQNIVNAIGLLGLQHFPCLAHTLQLAIKKLSLFQNFTVLLLGVKSWSNTLTNHQKKLTNSEKNRRCSSFQITS